MPTRKSKKSSRKTSKKTVAKKKTDIKPIVFVAAAAVVVVLAITALTMNPGYVPAPSREQQDQNPVQTPGVTAPRSSNQPCKSNIQCFVATCKNDPTVWTCVNDLNQDLSYEICNPAEYYNVDVGKDILKCACVNENCQAQ
jgi:hypothetical protein